MKQIQQLILQAELCYLFLNKCDQVMRAVNSLQEESYAEDNISEQAEKSELT